MENKGMGFFVVFENYLDMLLNLLSFLIAYVFTLMLPESIVNTPTEILLTNPYTILILVLDMLLASLVYHTANIYSRDRYLGTFSSVGPILRVNFIFFGIMALISAFVTKAGYKDFVLFWILISFVISTALIASKRRLIKLVLNSFRKTQYHLKKIIIVGDNTTTALEYLKAINNDAQNGVMVLGFVGDKMDATTLGIDKLGSFRELSSILDKYRPTDVIFAIDAYDKRRLIKLVNICEEKCIKVYFLPVIYGFFKSSRQIEQVGSFPIINIHSTPLDNVANRFIKRVVDIVGSAVLIVFTLPLMLVIAIGVKISSPGPVLFKQRRVGKMGKHFTMYKFRSMRVNKEANKTWTKGTDARKTKFGTILRQTAMDELPQLFNVFMGHMSLVGPRPEIPNFVKEFREVIPLYMIKHYVKPGMTGLAQVKGLRGDTSIEDRIQEDINYIENWSLWLDIVILLKTPFKAFNKNEQYVTEEELALLDESYDEILNSRLDKKAKEEPQIAEEFIIEDGTPVFEIKAVEGEDTGSVSENKEYYPFITDTASNEDAEGDSEGKNE